MTHKKKFPELEPSWRRFLGRGVAFAATVILGFQVSLVSADIFNGVESSVTQGVTTLSSPYIYSGTDFTHVGGEGVNSASLNIYDSMTAIALTGNPGSPNTPLIQSISAPSGVNQSTLAYSGAMATYQYTGPGSALITFDWNLTATLTEAANTGALVRAKAGLYTDVEYFSVDTSDFAEGGATVQDTMSYVETDPGIINESGTLSFTANSGDIFNLIVGLQTYAGRNGAITDAFNTFSGTLSSSQGSIAAVGSVPEPASAGFVAILGSVMLLRRRRS